MQHQDEVVSLGAPCREPGHHRPQRRTLKIVTALPGSYQTTFTTRVHWNPNRNVLRDQHGRNDPRKEEVKNRDPSLPQLVKFAITLMGP
jgi:hypothetical protein